MYNINYTDTNVLLYYRVVGANYSNLQTPYTFDENLFFQYLNGFNTQIDMVLDENGNSKKIFLNKKRGIFRKCEWSDFEKIGASQFFDNK